MDGWLGVPGCLQRATYMREHAPSERTQCHRKHVLPWNAATKYVRCHRIVSVCERTSSSRLSVCDVCVWVCVGVGVG